VFSTCKRPGGKGEATDRKKNSSKPPDGLKPNVGNRFRIARRRAGEENGLGERSRERRIKTRRKKGRSPGTEKRSVSTKGETIKRKLPYRMKKSRDIKKDGNYGRGRKGSNWGARRFRTKNLDNLKQKLGGERGGGGQIGGQDQN